MKKRAKSSSRTKRPTQGLAIAALILNIIIFPGLGTLIGGKTKTGIWQLVLAIISLPLMLVIIGFPLFIGVWIWGLVTGIQLIKEAK
jgi:hypothetical protein